MRGKRAVLGKASMPRKGPSKKAAPRRKGSGGKLPVKVKELPWQKMEDMYILTDPDTNQNYTLQPIPFLVWVQCDGKTDLDQIVDVFSVNGNRDIIKAALVGILSKLEESGLVKWV